MQRPSGRGISVAVLVAERPQSFPVRKMATRLSRTTATASIEIDIMDSHLDRTSRQPLVRFLGCVRPQLKLVVLAALMGVGKFTLPLAFPFAFKYVVDVL